MTAKETVIVVHGTFAAPVEGKPGWYEPGSEFCRQLDERLAARGSPARCWAHLDECGDELRLRAGRDTTYYSWSGHNSWIDRSAAAKQFWAEIEYLTREKGWTCHVVAHSHGGNVILEALDLDNPYRQGPLPSNFVLLGTPILQFSSRTNRWLGLRDRFREYTTPSIRYSGPRGTMPGREASWFWMCLGVAVSMVIWVLLASYFLKLAGLAPAELLFESLTFWVISIGAVVVMAALYWWHRHVATKAIAVRTGLPALREMFMIYSPRLLFINSQRDEAFGFLSGIRAATAWEERPDLTTTQNHKGAVTSWLRTAVRQAEEAERQHYPWRGRRSSLWVASIVAAGFIVLPLLEFLHLLWLPPFVASSCLIAGLLAAFTVPGPLFFVVAAPWRLAEAGAFLLSSFVRRIASEYARRNLWRTLQEIALGISGSPHRLDDVSVERCPNPEFARGEFLYEDINKTAEDAAVAARSRSFHSELEQIEEQSDEDFWRLDKWRERIGTIASDPALVHTVYYRHLDVIAQIASHLIRTATELLAERLRKKADKDNTPPSWVSWARVAVDALRDNLASRDPDAARALLDEMRHVAEARNEAAQWESWAKAAFTLMNELRSRDVVAARALLDDMRGVAEARNEAVLWAMWAQGAFDLMNDLGSRDLNAVGELLNDVRGVAEARNEAPLWEWWAKSAVNMMVELVPRDPIAGRELLADMCTVAEAHNEAPLWEMWARGAVILTGDLRSRDPVAARALLDDMRTVAEGRNEATLWEMWAIPAVNLIIALGSRDPVAARALLDDMRQVAEARNEAALWTMWAHGARSMMNDLRPRDPVAAQALLDAMRHVAEARNEAALWESWAKAAFTLMNELRSRDPAAARTLLDDMRGVAAARDEAPLWELWVSVAYDLTNDLRSHDPAAARALLDAMRGVAETRDEAPLWELWAKAAGNLMIDLPSRDPAAARALLDDMRRVAAKRNEVLLWELWATVAHNLANDLRSRDLAAARALLDDMRGVAVARDEAPLWELWAKAAVTLMIDLRSRDPTAARALLDDMRGVAEARNQAVLWEQWSQAAFNLMNDLRSRDPDASRALLHGMRGVAEARNEAPLWEMWATASFALIVELASRDPAASRALVDDMLKAVERHPGDAGGWQTKVVGLVLHAAFSLTEDIASRDPDAARTFCAEVLDLPEWLLQKMQFGG